MIVISPYRRWTRAINAVDKMSFLTDSYPIFHIQYLEIQLLSVHRLLFTMRGHRYSEGSYPTIAQNVLILIPYSIG